MAPSIESCSPLITPTSHKLLTAHDAAEDGAEARMRQALGKLGTARQRQPEAPRRITYQAKSGSGRHRFRQDGEVPVVRISLTESGRGGEHQPRVAAEAAGEGHGQRTDARAQDGGDSTRQVQLLVEQLEAITTRLGHAELVAGEASRTAQARQEEAAGLRLALDTAETTLAQVRAQLAASEQALAGIAPGRCSCWWSSWRRSRRGWAMPNW